MSKKLIVYYSYSGNTKSLVQTIEQQLNCDIVELEPVTPFSTDYQTVVDEWQNNSIKKTTPIKDINVNLDNYDTIILASPIWWYTITPVVMEFLKKYNLTNKTIIPVLTSAGWFGHAMADIKKLCPDSFVKNELLATYDENYALHKLTTSKPSLTTWLNSLN